MTTDVTRAGAVGLAVYPIAELAGIVVIVVALLLLHWPLGIFVLLGAPLSVWLMGRLSGRLARDNRVYQTLLAEAVGCAADLVAGHRVLRGVGATAEAARRYRMSSRSALAGAHRNVAVLGRFLFGANAVSGVFVVSVAGFAGWYAVAGELSVGELITAMGLAQALLLPMRMLTVNAIPLAVSATASSARILDALRRASPPYPGAYPGPTGGCRADSANPTAPPLSVTGEIALQVKSAEMLGVRLDPSTAGRLVEAFVQPDGRHGLSISLDGSAGAGLPVGIYRSQVLVSPQHATLFSGTITDNLTVPGGDRSLWDRALQAASCRDLVTDSEGRGRQVGEEGRWLSGGQRQRLALARALVKDPPVLVLHDPTSAVDSVTELSMADGLRAFRRGRSTIVITSSPALLAVCDRVIDPQPAGQESVANENTGQDPADSGTGGNFGRELWQTSAGHRRRFLLACLLGLISALSGLATPLMIGRLIDRVQAGTADAATVLQTVTTMTVAAVLGAAATAGAVVVTARAYHSMLADLREQLLAGALALPQEVSESGGNGDLIARSSDDVAEVADAAPQIIPALTTVGFSSVVSVAGLLVLDPWFTVVLLVLVPTYTLTVRWYLRTGPRIYRAERAAMGQRAQHLIESQRGHSSILGLDLADKRHPEVMQSCWQVVRHSLRARTVQNMFTGRVDLAEFLGMATILLIGFWLIGAGTTGIGATTAAMLLFLRLFAPIKQLLMVLDSIQSVLASLARVVGVITHSSTCRRPPAQIVDGADDQAVRMGEVTFGYDQRPVLHRITMTVGRGERVGIVGASGAGKSTLVALVAGIQTPDTGHIQRPARTAVVAQEAHVFAGTLRENLTLAAPLASDRELTAALHEIGVDQLLAVLPDGLDTVLGSHGLQLTAAQAQQIALARAVLVAPELVILDEAASEAGSAQAELLDDAARATLIGRTALVVAHRLSQAADCDRILVLAGGRIVESGTHDELLAEDGSYSRLWRAWCRSRNLSGE